MSDYQRARMLEPDWMGGIAPLQDEIRRLRALQAREGRGMDNWRPIEQGVPQLTDAQRHPNAFGVQVLIHPPYCAPGASPSHTAFYGCRYSDKPDFYLYGRLISVTHWMPLPAPPETP